MNNQYLLPFEQPGLLVDCHETISSSLFWTNLGDAELSRRIGQVVFGERPELIDEWMLGRVSAEYVHRVIASELDVDYEWIWGKFVSQARRFRMRGLPQLAALRGTFKIALVTINVDTFSRYTVTSKKLDTYVDAVLNSADVRMTKTNESRNLLGAAINLLSCQVENTILLDDNEKVCRHFADMGGHSICVREVSQTIAVLDELMQFHADLPTDISGAKIIERLRDSNLSNLLRWGDQVRSGS